MPDIPAEAVQAAAETAARAIWGEEECAENPGLTTAARSALDAAAPLLAEQVRREVAGRIRDLAKWEMQGGFVEMFAFIGRHDRLSHIEATHLSMAFYALADEIENPPARQIGESPR